MARRGRHVLVALGVVMVALVARRVVADLEVTVPPGTPSDWYREFADRVPFTPGAVHVAKQELELPEEEEESSGTTVRGKRRGTVTINVQELPKAEYGGNYQPMLFSGVITVDLPIHLAWTFRKGDTSPPLYPPPVTDDLYWMAQAGYLRRCLHPSLVGENEILWHLVALGQPSLEVGGPAKLEPFLTPLVEALQKLIPTLPKDPPTLPKGLAGGPEAQMRLRMVVADLANGDAYSLDPTYCWRTLSLGEDCYPQLVACAESDHPVLRRNAVIVLGHFDQKGVLDVLRKRFRDDTDAVVRTRALYQLVRRRDKEIVPDLVAQLAGRDARVKPLAAWALGVIRDPDAVDPLVLALTADKDDAETITCAVVALGRIGLAKEPVLKALRDLVPTLTAKEPRFPDTSKNRPEADIPDPVPLRNRLLLEHVVISLTRLGDKAVAKLFGDLLIGKWHDPSGPMGHALASGPERANQCKTLQWVCPTSIPALCETFAMMGKDGAPRLREAVEHAKTNEKLRVGLLTLPGIADDKKLLAMLAENDESAGVRSVAMKLLHQADAKAGAKLADLVLSTYAAGKPMAKKQPKGGVEVMAALEILYLEKKLTSKLLSAVLARAAKEFAFDPPKVTVEGAEPFGFTPPVIEATIFMLASVGDKDALGILKKFTEPDMPARAYAARALGRVKGGAKSLPALLDDGDAWVRYSAYLGLREASPADHFCDWLFGTPEEWKATRAKWEGETAKM